MRVTRNEHKKPLQSINRKSDKNVLKKNEPYHLWDKFLEIGVNFHLKLREIKDTACIGLGETL